MGERTLQSRRAPRPPEPTYGVAVAGPRHRQLTQLATALNAAPRLSTEAAARGGPGSTRLPERLKNGVEALSGIAMDNVRVHYDSPRPAQLQAHAFAQGGDIHLAPGQAHQLPHEAWHVAQQAQGRVTPTAQLNGGVAINDDSGLEREADAMGARALAVSPCPESGREESSPGDSLPLQAKAVVQRQDDDDMDESEGQALYDQVRSGIDFPDEESLAADPEYLPPASDDESDDGEDGGPVAMDESDSGSTAPEMSLEERRKMDAEALNRPFATSPLTDPDARFTTRSMSTSDKFKVGKVMGQRTQQSGPVAITLQSVALWVNDKLETRERPIAVSGIVEPTATTGRGGAPDPMSGVQIYMGQGPQPKSSMKMERNSGIPDAERGHVMALELGGPDIPQNIVPQWAKFQGSGDWRKMEQSVLDKAKKLPKGQRLRYSVDIFYKNSGVLTPTLRTFGFPSGFRATTQVIDGKTQGPATLEFHQGQAQDQTDQMLAERAMRKADGTDWDSSLDKQKAGGKRKRASDEEEATGKKRKKADG
ncbi:MAG TPA: DUF4157 domain-containing protein [Allosphingosinicella sp.]|nr:DUF4157 domain-containing protein [Allosphingosinicella sp.]